MAALSALLAGKEEKGLGPQGRNKCMYVDCESKEGILNGLVSLFTNSEIGVLKRPLG